MESRDATRETVHEFKKNVETVEELFPRMDIYLSDMEDLAEGYKEERVFEKLKSQFDDLKREFRILKPTL